MMARTHAAFAFLVSLFFIPNLNLTNKIIFIAFVVLGGLLTDLDHPKSKLGKKLKPLSYTISFFFGHRGFFHSMWIPLGILLIHWYIFPHMIMIALLIGYISHLVIDSFTVEGINFIHPFEKLHLSGFIKTGTTLETILFIALIILSIIKLVWGWGMPTLF